MSEPSRSPIKDRPLRHPGQSLQEERRRLFEDSIEPWLLLAAFFLVVTGLEWWRYYTRAPYQPLLFTLVALAMAAFAGWRVARLRPKFRALRQGIDGERAVGQYLEGLRGAGYRVFHDLVGSGFNIDHVLIGPAGVYTIETKTWSKPVRGDAHIEYDGRRLRVAGREPERDPLVQARAQASWLKGVLAESTGKTFDVFPVILFPGWWVQHPDSYTAKPWVLEPKQLPGFLEHEVHRLSPEDIALAGYHLSRHIRAHEPEQAP